MNKPKETITADLQKLRELIQEHTTDERFRQVKQIIGSLIERLDCARYHYQEYKDIIDSKSDIKEQFDFILGDVNKSYRETIAMTANVLAFMQSLHIVHDVLAHLISYALKIEFDDERRINLNVVHNRIKQESKFLAIDSLLEELRGHDDFQYIVANVNHSKHKYSIAPSRYLNLSSKPTLTCSFSPFVHHGIEYPKKDVDEIFKLEYYREEKIIIHIENTLIEILEKAIDINIS